MTVESKIHAIARLAMGESPFLVLEHSLHSRFVPSESLAVSVRVGLKLDVDASDGEVVCEL